MSDLAAFIARGGTPLDFDGMWDEVSRERITDLVQEAISQAHREDEVSSVARTVLGLYGHAFMVGRDHALAGLPAPTAARRSLAGLSAEDLSQIVVPDDVGGL